MNNALNNISGFGAPNVDQQFYQTNATALLTFKFYAFTPVNGDVTFTTLTDGSGSNVATAYNVSGTYWQNVNYFGTFESFTLATGEVLIHLRGR